MIRDFNHKFNKNLKLHRQAQGLDLDMLAIESGVSRTMLWNIENHKAEPTIGRAVSICEALGVSIDEMCECDYSKQWRSIESAPADVLVFAHDGVDVFVAILKDGFWFEKMEGGFRIYGHDEPASWMPIP